MVVVAATKCEVQSVQARSLRKNVGAGGAATDTSARGRRMPNDASEPPAKDIFELHHMSCPLIWTPESGPGY